MYSVCTEPAHDQLICGYPKSNRFTTYNQNATNLKYVHDHGHVTILVFYKLKC